MRLNFSPSPARPRYWLRSQRGEASGRCQALGVPAYGVGHIARAEPGPGATEQPRAGQEVEPHPLAPHIDERPHLARLGGQGLAGGRHVDFVAGVDVAHGARRGVHVELVGLADKLCPHLALVGHVPLPVRTERLTQAALLARREAKCEASPGRNWRHGSPSAPCSTELTGMVTSGRQQHYFELKAHAQFMEA
jgi:hypothetical protein